MDTAQWPQDTIVKPMEEIVSNNTSSCSIKAVTLERKVRTQKEEALNCPRCNSTNTKFCYYNNYSLSQPRYFCKTCKRYWTAGGTLRSIPIGGGSRKNKRSTLITTTSSSSSLAKKNLDNDLVNPNNKIHNVHTQDLNLGFSKTITQDFKNISELIKVPNFETNESSNHNNNNNNSLSALELISNGISPRGGLNSFFPIPNLSTDLPDAAVYNSSNGFSLLSDYFKPSLSFSLDGFIGNGTGYGSLLQGVQEPSGRLLFPFEDLKQVSGATNSTDHNIIEQNRDLQHGDSNGFWNGVLGGGSW